MKKVFLLASLLAFYSLPVLGADFLNSVKDGNWNDPASWDLNVTPSSWTIVSITHTITYNLNMSDVSCSSITIDANGILKYDKGSGTRTLILGGHLDIKSGGQFLMPPNTGYVSVLELKKNQCRL